MNVVQTQHTAALALLPEAVAITRLADGLLRYANPRFLALFGLTLDQLAAGVYMKNLYVRPADRERLKQRLTSGEAARVELEMRRVNGRSFWGMLSSATVIYDGETCILGTLIDISDRKQIELALARSEQHYRALVENARSIILRWTPQGEVLYINPYAEEIFGYTPRELIGKHVVGTIVPAIESTSRDLTGLIEGIVANPDHYRVNINENIKKNGERVWILWTNTTLRDAAGRAVEVLSIGTDITRQRLREEHLRAAYAELQEQYALISTLQQELREQSVRDPLTGAFNRRYLQETLPRELARCRRDHTPLSVVMIDADMFKSINDAHGHKAGDIVLKALASLLLTHSREGDVVCRYGGEEFVVLLPEADLDMAVERAESWRHAFAELVHRDGSVNIKSTISLGVGSFPVDGGDEHSLLQAADRALYAAKRQGRNRVVPAPGCMVRRLPDMD
jgi:diguanylate cyclase (GGDEF)-like protein/PAS domain S-box-containing protein